MNCSTSNGAASPSLAIIDNWDMPHGKPCTPGKFRTAAYKLNFGNSKDAESPGYKHDGTFFLILQRDEPTSDEPPTTPVEERKSYIDLVDALYETLPMSYNPRALRKLFDEQEESLKYLCKSKEWEEAISDLPECPLFDPDPRKKMFRTLKLTGVIDIMSAPPPDKETNLRWERPTHRYSLPGDAKFQWYRPSKMRPESDIHNGFDEFYDAFVSISRDFRILVWNTICYLEKIDEI